jgi:hypothetical protein
MRRRVLSGLVAAGAALALPAGVYAQDLLSPMTHVQVGPRAIGTHTDVRLRLRQPMTTGDNGGERSVEAVDLTGPSRRGCIGTTRVVLAAAREGTTIRHTLRPRWLGGRWCTGTYEGRLTYQVQPDCTNPGPIGVKLVACPMFIMAPRTLATFHFRVTAR